MKSMILKEEEKPESSNVEDAKKLITQIVDAVVSRNNFYIFADKFCQKTKICPFSKK